MIQTEKPEETARGADVNIGVLPISVVLAVRNEAHNLPRCLEGLRYCGEVYFVDSHSTDATCEIAAERGAIVVQFDYRGGRPKKRHEARYTHALATCWVLIR